MTDGKIVQVGTPHEIYEYPQSRFVADFIGSVNIFEGRIADDNEDHVIITSEDTNTDIHVSHGISGVEGQKVAVAVRPEKISLSKNGLPDLKNTVAGTIEEIAYMGDTSVYQIGLKSGKKVRVSRSNLTRAEEDDLTWEDAVTIGWDGTAGVVVTS